MSLSDQLSKVKAVIIGCANMRVDPAYVLGIESGEAVVLRKIGGRVTPNLGEQLGLLGRIGEVAERIPGGGGEFHVIVLQHTDCGITRLVSDPELLAPYFEIGKDELCAKAINDPRKAVFVSHRADFRHGFECIVPRDVAHARLSGDRSPNCARFSNDATASAEECSP